MYNIHVETAHSLAYKHIIVGSSYKVCQKRYNTYEIADLLKLKSIGEKHGEYILANHISKFMTLFCNSNVAKVQDINYPNVIKDEKAKSFVLNFYRSIEQGTRLLLSKMYNGEIEVTHDFYLKLFQLSKPVLSYDYILFDEGQDASQAMLDIFLNQKAIKVIVGDTHQQIYSWRHAINSLGKVDFPEFNLTSSFRFNQDIANLSMEILSWKRYIQNIQPVSIIGKGNPVKTKNKATIARTNLGLLLKAITFITEHKGVEHIYFEGNINSYTYADEGASLYDVLNLHNNNLNRIKDKLISSMSNMKELEEYIEKTEDVQLAMMMKIVKEYENQIPILLKTLKNKHVGDAEKGKAEMIFSTVHRSKGMEYDAVQLVEDFVTERKLEKIKSDIEEKQNDAKWIEEINLLYVAITRTKGLLRIPEALLPNNFPKSPYIYIIKAPKEDTLKEIDESKLSLANHHTSYQHKNHQKIGKAYTLTEKRKKHKNAYERWTPEYDLELKNMYKAGINFLAISNHFHRNEGAIRSRLRKLGLIE